LRAAPFFFVPDAARIDDRIALRREPGAIENAALDWAKKKAGLATGLFTFRFKPNA